MDGEMTTLYPKSPEIEKVLSPLFRKNVHFSSVNLKYRTPEDTYQKLHAEFNFDFDTCPPNPLFDGLSVEWGNSNFVNPPYGREIQKWVKKGFEEYRKGKTVVFLIPSRTDSRWWHEYIMKATEIRFIKGGLKFQGAIYNAPFPSCVAVFQPLSRMGNGYSKSAEDNDLTNDTYEKACLMVKGAERSAPEKKQKGEIIINTANEIRMSQVTESLNDMENSITSLEANISTLIEKLTPVLLLQPQTTEGSLKATQATKVNLATAIDTLRERIVKQTAIINDALARLEL